MTLDEQADFATRLAKQLQSQPWMVEFLGHLRYQCHDCKAKVGELHSSGCDTARCSVCQGQLLSCGCPDGKPDIWSGLMYPLQHQVCLKDNLWSRDLIRWRGKEYVAWGGARNSIFLDMRDNLPGFSIQFDVPCDRDDAGADANLNGAG